MALDSSAAFFERVQQLELGEHEARFRTIGWLTFAKMAHDTTYCPGGDESKYEADILVKGLQDAAHPHKGLLRRLFFEAYTLSAGDLRARLEGPSIGAPRIVPNAERLARRKRCAQKLVGMELKGELDISDALLDKAIDMYDSNGIYYLGLEVCTKKTTSLMGPQRDRLWEPVPNATGTFQFRRIEDQTTASYDTQFAFTFAMQRKNLALEMGDLLGFEYGEKLRNKYTAVMMNPPQTGYAWVTMEQVLDADMLFWDLMADEVIEGVRRNAGGRPCDQAFQTVFDSTEFRMAIATRQIGVHRPQLSQQPKPQPRAAPPPTGGEPLTKRQKKLLAAEKRASASASAAAQPPPDGKGKGKGKPKGKTTAAMPKALIGMCQISNSATNNQRFCYGFNLGSCKGAAPGQACPKGFHGCMKPLANGEACSQPHAVSACTR